MFIDYPIRYYLDSKGEKQCALPVGGIQALHCKLPENYEWISDIIWIKLESSN